MAYHSKNPMSIVKLIENVFPHRFIFFFGDFNYRIDDLEIEAVKEHVKNGQIPDLLTYDQVMQDQGFLPCLPSYNSRQKSWDTLQFLFWTKFTYIPPPKQCYFMDEVQAILD